MTDFAKADFYLGFHENAKYIGTTLKNGSPWNIPLPILTAETKQEYLDRLNKYLENEIIEPFKEWPHLWLDGHGTDYSYFFHDGKVYCTNLGDKLFDPIEIINGATVNEATINTYPRFPKMTEFNQLGARNEV